MSGIIYYWRAGSSYRQSDESFSRSGTRYALNDKTGLYEQVSDGVPRTSSWVHATDGNTYRTLELALGDTPVTDDSARFDSASGWSRFNIGSEASKTSIFKSLPTNGEARTITGDGTGTCRLDQSPGTASGGKEVVLAVLENQGSDALVAVDYRDATAGSSLARAKYDFSSSTFTEVSGDAGHTVLTDSGENGGETVMVWAITDTTNGNNRTFSVRPDHDGAGNGAVIHYAAGHELAYVPGLDPQVGTASAIPGESFSVSPGPYRNDVAQVAYISFVAGTLVGDTGDTKRVVEHGDGVAPGVRVQEAVGTAGGYNINFPDADGNNAGGNINIGSSDQRQYIEMVYAYDPSDGNARLLARVDGGSWNDSGASTPASWTTPDSFGSSNRIVYNERANLNGSNRGHQFYRRHLVALAPSLDNDPFTGGASAVGDEMAALAELNA